MGRGPGRPRKVVSPELERIEAELNALVDQTKEGESAEASASSPATVKTQTALAHALGVHRETVRLWMKRPGNPGLIGGGNNRRYDVDAWDKWAAEYGPELSVRNKNSDKKNPSSKVEWEINRLRTVCETLRFDLEVKKGTYSLNADIERWVSDAVTNLKSSLLQLPSKLAPQVVALESPVEAEAVIRKEIDDALVKLHEGDWIK